MGNDGHPYRATVQSFQFWLGENINDQLLRPAHTPPKTQPPSVLAND
jgi:hypothetical protein